MRKTWEGLWVCKEDWEPKHPQLSIKAKQDDQSVPVVRPDKASIVGQTTTKDPGLLVNEKSTNKVTLTNVSTLAKGDSVGVTLDDGTVQWLQLSKDPSGQTIYFTEDLWGDVAYGNVVLLTTVADVNFLSSAVSADDL
jgi:hypothetical protein